MGRIVRAADFQRVLGTAPRARSRHFAVHHLRQSPTRWARRTSAADSLHTGLSTDAEQACPQAVEDVPANAAPQGVWLGLVVPKRNAKRSVTRSLVKRQMRAVMAVRFAAPVGGLEPGMWVVRLRSPIDRKQFPSAASDALREAMREELKTVVEQAARRVRA